MILNKSNQKELCVCVSKFDRVDCLWPVAEYHLYLWTAGWECSQAAHILVKYLLICISEHRLVCGPNATMISSFFPLFHDPFSQFLYIYALDSQEIRILAFVLCLGGPLLGRLNKGKVCISLMVILHDSMTHDLFFGTHLGFLTTLGQTQAHSPPQVPSTVFVLSSPSFLFSLQG